MAYSEKYIMSFVSERGNDYRIVILQQNYTGEAVQKKLGVAPVLSVESGDGRIQGSSLAFSIQSDTEGELRGLYTTNNKEFKALLYRNGVLYWQGYLLPELYSENYIYPPYDVAVTATDQLATLKDVAYAGEDAQTSLLDIIKNILSHTQINLQCKVHMNLNDGNGISVLRGSYISAATYNGQSCYDALNAILLSCNCTIMQMGNQWLITSFTDYSYSYDLEGSEVLEAHATIGQMHQGDVWPSGSLNMVNAPALKGAKVDYNHTLRNSFLKNADITSRESWMYTPDSDDNGRFPGVINGIDGKSYKCHFWQLWQQNLTENDSLQLWQDVRLDQDAEYSYSVSVKYLFANLSDLLLMAVSFLGDDGVNWRLTADGWTENFNNKDVYSYIQITSNSTVTGYLQEIANISNYEIATVKFNLPAKNGKIRIGFINSTDYKSPFLRSPIYLTQVYFSIEGITGQTATTEVEKMATSVQEELLLSYGDKVSSSNGERLTLNTLRDAEGAAKSAWNLSGREFPSYYMAMLQEYSRYYGSKKMQLQGVVMGKDAFRAFYIDSFSGLVMRLLSGQYNLLEDEVNISLEEVVTSFVYYDTVVYATDNKPQQNNSTSAGAVVSGGGATTLGGLINVDDKVDEVDAEIQVLVKDLNSKVWTEKALAEVSFNEQKVSDYLIAKEYLTKSAANELYASIDVVNYFVDGAAKDAVRFGGELPEYYATKDALNVYVTDYSTFKTDTQLRLEALEALWAIDEDNNGLYPKSGRGIWSESYITAGGQGTSGGGSGTGGGLIQNVYGYADLGGTYSNNILTDTFNAYAINQLYISGEAIKDRVEALEANMGVINPDTLLSLNNYISRNSARITNLEDWIENPVADVAYFNELGVRDKLNISGPATFNERITGVITEAVNLTGTPEIKITGDTIAILIGEKTSAYITVPYANNALKLGGQLPEYYATASALSAAERIASEGLSRISNLLSSIEEQMCNASFETIIAREVGIEDKLNVAGDVTINSNLDVTGIATATVLITGEAVLNTATVTTLNGFTPITSGNISSQYVMYAATAGKLTDDALAGLTVGQSTQPVYFSGGVPVACTRYADASVNYATTAALAVADKQGNDITTTYTKKTETRSTGYAIGKLSNLISELEDWVSNPTADTAYFNELGIRDKLNVSGLSTFDANVSVNANIVATGAITAGSDARYKNKLQDVAVDIETIANAPLFNFRWNDGREDNRTYLGTTAQYWSQTDFKNAVIPTNDRKLWTMSYSQIAMGNTIVLARELLPIKSKVSEIDNLKDRLHKAERKIEILEQELNQYRRA